MHLAAERGYVEVAKELVRAFIKKNVSLDEGDEDDNTPLHLATKNKHKDIVQDLIDNNADIQAAGEGGKKPLHMAAE